MSKPAIEVGAVVKSTAGRDEGRVFVVIESLDEEYVLISDGDTHKIEKPKKKKRKHLKLSYLPDNEIAERLRNGKQAENYEIRKWLSDKEE